MNRFLHDDLRPKNLNFSLGKLEQVKELADTFKEVNKKLSGGTLITHRDAITKPEVSAFPKLGSEMTKPILLFMGKTEVFYFYKTMIIPRMSNYDSNSLDHETG